MQNQPASQVSRASAEPPPDIAAIQVLLRRAGIPASDAEIRAVARTLARLAPPAEARA
ncbi:hypothetical protein [Bordetella petrii]|uniref:hypothetical protein n=1 Tax=Bordetella petrii TaxID=94624 RepID=UPI001A975CFE|nr:hypothetical protein [Bordetella petrii]MBO1112919.1 hypothetical protein [Bordetella petrii]